MSSPFRASIVIATYNHATNLLKFLESIAQLETDPTKFEILIIDNNSSDNTKDVCLEFIRTHPVFRVRYIFETQQGASYARNRGVLEACEEIVCFLDDDSPPSPHWLNTLLEVFSDPGVGCAGGPSVLDFQGQEIPWWLQGNMQGLLSSYSLSYSEPSEVSSWTQFPLSCNMAIQRMVFIELGFLRTDLGKIGDHLLAAAETDLAHRIHEAGWKIIYVPDARVQHFVTPDRLRLSYLFRRSRGLAESHIILTADSSPRMIARWFASDLWYSARRLFWLLLAIIGLKKELWFDDFMRFWMVAIRIPLRIKMLLRIHIIPLLR